MLGPGARKIMVAWTAIHGVQLVDNFIVVSIAGLAYGGVIAIAALGFTLQFGTTNYFNFAYAEMMEFGALIAVTLNITIVHWNIWIAGIIGAAAAGLFAAALNRSLFRPFLKRYRNIWTMLIVTFSLALLLDNIYLLVWGSGYYQYSYSPGPGIHIGTASIQVSEFVILGIVVICLGLVHLLLTRTRLGRMMRAMSDNSSLATICGLNTKRITEMTWLVSGILAGLAGVLLALETHTFDSSVGVLYEYYVFVAVILGGVGSAAGAVLGGLVVGLATSLSGLIISSGLSPVAVFALMILVLFIRPMGLMGVPGRLSRTEL